MKKLIDVCCVDKEAPCINHLCYLVLIMVLSLLLLLNVDQPIVRSIPVLY